MRTDRIPAYAAALFLVLSAVSDLKTRRISLQFVLLFAFCAIPARLLAHSGGPVFSVFCALLPGLAAVVLSILSRGGLGLGDALVLLVLGLYDSSAGVMASLLFGLFFSSVYAGVQYILLRRRKDYSFAFLPFLAAGYGVRVILAV